MMLLDRGRYSIVAEVNGRKKTVAAGTLIDEEEEVLAPAVEQYDDEFRHTKVFLEDVRQHERSFANTATGHHATNPGHLMNISWQVGCSIRWDGRKDQVIDDPEANALVTKPYRAPWKLEA